MRGVSFSTEPTIHNLEDAPPPQPDMLSLSPVIDLRVSPSGESSLRRSNRSSLSSFTTTPPPPPPALYSEHDSLEEDGDGLAIPSVDGDIEDSAKMGEEEDESDTFNEQEEVDDGDTTGEILDEDAEPPLKVFGYTLPTCCQRRTISWTRVSAYIVNYAPCFLCTTKRHGTGITDWEILYRLNILCSFFASGQIASAIWLLVILYAPGVANRSLIGGRNERDEFAPNFWSLNGTIYIVAFVGLATMITTLVTLRYIKRFNMVGLLRYLWVMYWLIPLEILLVVGLFDYHRVTEVWTKHWWYVPALAWFRKQNCAAGTDRTLCTVPVCGLPSFGIEAATAPYEGTDTVECINGEREWCAFYFNATDCREIRDSAQTTVERNLLLYYYLNVIWGALLILLLLLTVQVLEALITIPIVQKSRESNVPGWLTFPIVWSAVAGTVLLFSPSSVLSTASASDHTWIAICFLVTSGLFFMAALWGWFLASFTIMNNRDKQTKRVVAVLFVFTLISTLLFVAVIFSASIVTSTEVVDVGLAPGERGRIACSVDTADSCSFCNGRFDGIGGLVECPEWTDEDVSKVVQSQLKHSATWAAIFMVYATSALRFGINLRRHINQYEIDYV